MHQVTMDHCTHNLMVHVGNNLMKTYSSSLQPPSLSKKEVSVLEFASEERVPTLNLSQEP